MQTYHKDFDFQAFAIKSSHHFIDGRSVREFKNRLLQLAGTGMCPWSKIFKYVFLLMRNTETIIIRRCPLAELFRCNYFRSTSKEQTNCRGTRITNICGFTSKYEKISSFELLIFTGITLTALDSYFGSNTAI